MPQCFKPVRFHIRVIFPYQRSFTTSHATLGFRFFSTSPFTMLVASQTLLFPVVLLSTLFSILFGCEAAPARRQTTNFSQTALVIATSATAGDEATSIISGLGQQFQLLAVSQGGTPLPALETTGPSGTVGNFGLFIVVALASYDYGGSTGWASAITKDQWTALYAYQVKYGVR